MAATSQVSAAQWQSFEMRMRQRRAARLVVRAQAALEQGLVADAAAALEEAQGLDSSTPDLATLMATVPAAPAPVADLPLVTEAPFEEPLQVEREHRATGWIAVAASLAIVGSLVTWGVVRFSPTVVPPTTSSDTSAPVAMPEQPTAVAGPEQPLTATTGHADLPAAPAVPAVALNPPAKNDVHDVDPPVVKAPPPRRAAADESTAPDPEPVHVTVPVPVTTPASLPSSAASTAAASPAEPVRELPATERTNVAVPEVALAPPILATSTSEISVPAAVVAPPPIPPAPAEAPRVDDTPLVRRVLSQYETAYSSLDVSAAKRVWPSVDSFALARAFDGLQMQRISLGDCRVSLNGPTARANCRGSAQWTPKIGGGTRSGSRSWAFDLRKTDGQWRIVDVTTR